MRENMRPPHTTPRAGYPAAPSIPEYSKNYPRYRFASQFQKPIFEASAAGRPINALLSGIVARLGKAIARPSSGCHVVPTVDPPT